MECDFGNTVAGSPQLWDWLENRKSKNNEISREVWKIVEIKERKTRVAEVEGKRKEEKPKKKRTMKVKKVVEKWEI